MKTQGIRIFDKKNNSLDTKLSDILEVISNGPHLNWCILFLDGMPNPNRKRNFIEYQNSINKSKKGLLMNWKDIQLLTEGFFQIYEILLLASSKKTFRRHINDQEIYETYDIVIEQIDCAFWQVFSKDPGLIIKLREKFHDTKVLESDFNPT